MEQCPLCQGFFLLNQLEKHVEEELAAQAANTQASRSLCSAAALCERCGRNIPLAELDSHLLAHELDEPGAAVATAAAGDGDAADLERLAFEELRARYGWAERPNRPGFCRVCGEPGHWVRECQKNPEVQAAKQRIIPDPLTAEKVLAAQQAVARPPSPPGGLIARLAAVLSQQSIPANTQYRALLCAPHVRHFGAGAMDAGWGCGYRNVQMLTAHLLAMDSRPEARSRLFGGTAVVPDIPSLQAWLEVAWAAGFDRQGCEQLGGAVQGTHKWIGTTEVAALLRYFGLRTRIADFGAVDKGPDSLGSVGVAFAAQRNGINGSSGGQQQGTVVEVHASAQCDGCGMQPLLGPRYKSQVLADYDLCSKCHTSQGGATAAASPFMRIMAPQYTVATTRGSSSSTMPDQLLRWVWRYFSTPDTPAASTAAAGASSGGGPAARADAKRQKLAQQQQQQDRVAVSNKPGLYLQHEGHSRTIIGIERRVVGKEGKEEFGLLVLDPGCSPAALAAALHEGKGWQRWLKRGSHTINKPQYQLLWVEPGEAMGAELEALKLVAASERY